ncbi:MAG TPA: phosphatase PAP2 family protein [Anaerolineae bacterium]|nr:phosphatase PAP2 family protein [Anaerolineae bacterium]
MNPTLAVPLQEKNLDKYPLAHLRSPGLLARWPLIGVVMVLLGGLLFGAMAINLQTHGPLLPVDVQVSDDLHVIALQSSPAMREVMIFGFYMGEHVIMAIGLILVLYFLYKRFWPELSMVVIAWAGEGTLWLVLTPYFNRARPVFDVSIWRQMTEPGFPSGHSISAVMCYGLLAYLIVPKISSRFWQAVVIVTTGLVILYIGFSRMFVGDHYLTDILAGYGLGVAWSGLVYTLVEVIARKIKHKKSRKNQPA